MLAVLKKLPGFGSPWPARLRKVEHASAVLLKKAGVICLVRAHRVQDSAQLRLVVELGGDQDWDKGSLAAVKGLLVHGLNNMLGLDLTSEDLILGLAGDPTAALPSLEAAASQLRSRHARPPVTLATSVDATTLPGDSLFGSTPVEVTEFGESQWSSFGPTEPASSDMHKAVERAGKSKR